MPVREGTYGLLAEFDTPTQLVRAAEGAYAAGYRRMDCYTPYPVEEAAEAIGFHKNAVSLVCLIGGLLGLAAMFGLETWISFWAYPLNIAGRPYYSWPAFVVPAYEWTILFAGLSAAFGMLALNGCRRCITRCSTRRTFAAAQPATSSSCASSRPIRSSRQRRRGRFLSDWRRFQWWRWSINPMKTTGQAPPGRWR